MDLGQFYVILVKKMRGRYFGPLFVTHSTITCIICAHESMTDFNCLIIYRARSVLLDDALFSRCGQYLFCLQIWTILMFLKPLLK